MKNKALFTTLLAIIVPLFIVISVVAISKWSTPKNPPVAGNILFTRLGCPHCKIVDEYIKTNKVTDKITFDTRDLAFDTTAIDTINKIFDYCRIPDAMRGVPMYWDGVNCYSGDGEITDYFSKRIN